MRKPNTSFSGLEARLCAVSVAALPYVPRCAALRTSLRCAAYLASPDLAAA